MRRASLLGDVEVKRWYENLRRGAKVTADHYLARLGHIREMFEINKEKLGVKLSTTMMLSDTLNPLNR